MTEIILLIFLALSAIAEAVYWGLHPELTEMQMFSEAWPINLFAAGIASILIYRTRFK